MARSDSDSDGRAALEWKAGYITPSDVLAKGSLAHHVVVTVVDDVDLGVVAEDMVAQSEAARRFRAAASRLDMSAPALLTLLDALAAGLPAGADAPGAGLTAEEEDALRRSGSYVVTMPPFGKRASTRTALRTARVLAPMLDVKTVAHLLGVTEGRVRQRLAERTLLGSRAQSGWRLPAFQFDEGSELPGWDRILAALPADVHPLSVAHFLDTPHPDLGVDDESVPPRIWLRVGGDIDRVVALAGGLYDVP